MKKLFFTLILIASVSLTSMAQFTYNVDQLANSMAEAGLKAVFEDNLARRNFEEIYRISYRNIYVNGKPSPIAYFYMGACLEMGLGGCEVSTYKAQAHYEKGASLGNAECKRRLRDIASYGYWSPTAEARNSFAAAYGRYSSAPAPSPAPSPTPGRSHSHSHDTGSKCTTCNGSGECSYCKGTGKKIYDAGAYVAGDHYVLRTCSLCGGTGKCGVCHGKGYIR